MKGYLMYNDNYYPSMAEDDMDSSLIYPDYDYESYESDEWLNSQENDLNDPILPLPEDQDAWTGQEEDLDIQERSARPIPNRPVPPRPIPPRPTPPRPIPPRPVPPVRPDWSWNWGTILPGIVLPLSPARVRFYNASVPGPIQIYVNNRLVVSNLNYLQYSRIYNVIPGRYRITVYQGNDMR